MAKHRLLILGAGTAGTVVANRMRRELDPAWEVAVVDPSSEHLYQPGLLFIPFGDHDDAANIHPRARTLDPGVRWVESSVAGVDLDKQWVTLHSGDRLRYDLLVLATGTRIRPDLTEGLVGKLWQTSVFDFYTLEGARALRGALEHFPGGRVVVNVVEMPIKCPVAPLEFLFLADAFFRKRGMRDSVELVYATPLDGAFTKPLAAEKLGHLLEEKGIRVETEFSTGSVDEDERAIVSWDERRVDFDILVTVPTHSGADFIEAGGFGDELGFLPTEPRTLLLKGHENVFAMGDATNLPTSKAGSVAHFQAETVVDNLHRWIAGKAPEPTFDGHANCFVETGFGKAMLIDFNYEVDPVPGKYPWPRVGPFSLLEESRANHLGKRGFRWFYFNGLLAGRPMPVPAQMSMAGKVLPATE